jgi:hypothetical protein
MFGGGMGPRTGELVAVEINHQLAERLRGLFPLTEVICADFLDWAPDRAFDRIIMNPPFQNGSDIRHILHARAMLAPGGRLVAVCANGPRQQQDLYLRADQTHWQELPAGTFEGTGVRAAIVVLGSLYS